jgi:hypothetical protein
MADLSDVEQALVALAAAALYPQGPAGPAVVNRACRVYRGSPSTAALDADLAAGYVNVTVFPERAHQRNTTRWPDAEYALAAVVPALSIAVQGATALMSGDAASGQVAGLLVDGVAAVYRTRPGDTPAMVAAALAGHVASWRQVQVDGASVTVPGAGLLIGRVVADQPVLRETRRQRQGFRITCWCPDPAIRDEVAAALDTSLSAQAFIALSDGTSGRLRFVSSSVFDQSQDAALYRRDLLYSVEYGTTLAAMLPSMVFGDSQFAAAGSGTLASQLV